ncbi:uncharacterized protein LOC125028632 [Penaeus chinensis]|uniref:uncharacterized protein LOC125028632 n=1 Tax=Penaeus chinensis TaxID=139456 RepID=UPI001FB82578|nr:uncharacterized protein LOC125028632 [Penaeus chinensis]
MCRGGAVTLIRDMVATPLFTLALLTAQIAAGAAMKGLKVKVPRVAYIGDNAELECNFPGAETASLYSIKWWRDNDQFYQYIPKHKEPKMQFNVFGIKVDIRCFGYELKLAAHFKVFETGSGVSNTIRNLSLEIMLTLVNAEETGVQCSLPKQNPDLSLVSDRRLN